MNGLPGYLYACNASLRVSFLKTDTMAANLYVCFNELHPEPKARGFPDFLLSTFFELLLSFLSSSYSPKLPLVFLNIQEGFQEDSTSERTISEVVAERFEHIDQSKHGAEMLLGLRSNLDTEDNIPRHLLITILQSKQYFRLLLFCGLFIHSSQHLYRDYSGPTEHVTG
jgi:hypothetical protein